MAELPVEAVAAAAQALHEAGCSNATGPPWCTTPLSDWHLDRARTALAAAEAVWPHGPPSRDPASTTSCGTERRSQDPTHQAPARGRAFGFGPPQATACQAPKGPQ